VGVAELCLCVGGMCLFVCLYVCVEDVYRVVSMSRLLQMVGLLRKSPMNETIFCKSDL